MIEGLMFYLTVLPQNCAFCPIREGPKLIGSKRNRISIPSFHKITNSIYFSILKTSRRDGVINSLLICGPGYFNAEEHSGPLFVYSAYVVCG